MSRRTARVAQRTLRALGYGAEVVPVTVSPTERAGRPRVTVVVPCYNYGHYLAGCVGSALQQDDVDVDVVIVDDASPDGSGDVSDALAAQDARVTAIRHKRNRGHIQTYEDGLAAATGTYVSLLSADDLLTPGALGRAVRLMELRPEVGLVYGGAVHFMKTPPAARTVAAYWLVWPGVEWLRVRAAAGYNCIASPEVVMRTSVLRQIGGYRVDLPHTADLELWMRAARVSDVGYVYGADQAFYRQHAVNMHKTLFRSGSAAGEVIDLDHRLRAFDAVFEPGSEMTQARDLSRLAHRTLAREALKRANHAYARGFADAPIEEFVRFAVQHDPYALQRRAGRALRRRQRLGMLPVPLHPLWATREATDRVTRRARLVRLNRIGV